MTNQGLRIFKWLFFMMMALVVAGCYQQARDSFEPIDSQQNDVPTNTPVPATPLDLPVTNTLPPTTDGSTTQGTPVPPTSTLTIIQPTATSQSADPLTVPTATEPGIITPEPPPGAVDLPTAGPTFTPLPATPSGLVTPTDLPPEIADECTYVVQSGDNLFRISVNLDVALDELRALNNLTGELIQPGDTLLVPGCIPGQEEIVIPEVTVNPTVLASGSIVHVIQSGETLGAIATRYGVTVDDIVTANDLDNPNVIAEGQEIIIPNPQN